MGTALGAATWQKEARAWLTITRTTNAETTLPSGTWKECAKHLGALHADWEEPNPELVQGLKRLIRNHGSKYRKAQARKGR